MKQTFKYTKTNSIAHFKEYMGQDTRTVTYKHVEGITVYKYPWYTLQSMFFF